MTEDHHARTIMARALVVIGIFVLAVTAVLLLIFGGET
jgi:hypothetical protein